MMDLASMLMKHIFKTLFTFNDRFWLMMDFPYELIILVKRSPGPDQT